MKNWIRNSHWHYTPGPLTFATAGGAGIYFLDPVVRRWYHGPGVNGATVGSFNQAVQGDWEGNPEQFLRLTWTTAPTQGDASYYPVFRNTILEHWINRARILALKQVTLSWQLRSGGAPIALVIWRSIPGQPMERWSSPQFNVPGDGHVHRYDFTMTLPGIVPGYDISQSSFLGVGVDLFGQSGPSIDFGPCQLNEGGPAPIEETQYEEEKLWATQLYP